MNQVALFDPDKINAIEVFADKDSIDPILRAIESEVVSHVPDVTTDKGRKHIASIANKVARSKTALDDAGKNLVTEWKQKAGIVDASRKHARDFLDELKIKVRKPLTDWEEEQARIEAERIAAEAAKIEAERIAKEAIERAERERLEAEIAEMRAKESARLEVERIANEERLAKERAEQAERDRVAREELIAKEAAQKAQRDAEAQIQAAKDEALRQERLRMESEARAKIQAEQAVKAEQERVASEKAAADKIAAEKAAIEAKRAANEKHRKTINNAILAELIAIGASEEVGKAIITAIASGKINNIQINY